ncbi:YhcH/YjgK/YiaL family protein [Flavicella sediminum]|uniref:YhcH/YjgK/YiaL family protein n=1 Tax=Flavicella sediminum TaxID=2585141 RepID=UPI00111D6A49|nr:YhcH/YjgK/YiaL family protein [Flavicella sediminum]
MILDKIDNQHLYSNCHPRFKKAFDYINQTDLSEAKLGKHSIDGDEVFGILMEYNTLKEVICKSESHKKYIDIQYMVAGEENVGMTTLVNQKPTTPYNETEDFTFYTLEPLPKLKLKTGYFAIFFPDDIHQTMIQVDYPKKLRKFVIKVLKDEL